MIQESKKNRMIGVMYGVLGTFVGLWITNTVLPLDTLFLNLLALVGALGIVAMYCTQIFWISSEEKYLRGRIKDEMARNVFLQIRREIEMEDKVKVAFEYLEYYSKRFSIRQWNRLKQKGNRKKYMRACLPVLQLCSAMNQEYSNHREFWRIKDVLADHWLIQQMEEDYLVKEYDKTQKTSHNV